jgi:hypothetical protein
LSAFLLPIRRWLGSTSVWKGELAFDRQGVIRNANGVVIGERGLEGPDIDPPNLFGKGIIKGAFFKGAAFGLGLGSLKRGLWQLTKEGTDKMLGHNKFGTFYRHASTGLWWSYDNAGHGGSVFKVFTANAKGLVHIADADEYGDFITGKHKGAVGLFIPWSELGGK